MALPSQSKSFVLKNPPTDLPVLEGSDATWSFETKPLADLKDDQVLIQTVYISNDPAQRGWITKGLDPERLYVPPIQVGDLMRSRNVSRVLDSRSSKYAKGDLVLVTTGWTDYIVVDASKLERKIDNVPGLKETHFLGALGMTGLTAYYGTKEVARAGPGDTVVVSGAAGATGSMVVQIAKHLLGCKRVIGMAGEPAKCKWVESLGADICLNYKDSDFKQKLIKETEGYVEVYFDNVGGDILDLVLTRMKRHGRVAACGAVSQYNQSEKDGLKNWFEVISNRLEIRGFIVLDFVAQGKAPAAIGELVQAFKDGKIKLGDENETVVDTKFEDTPKTWMRLFEGKNTGKLVTHLV